MAITERCEEVGEEGEGHGRNQAHQVVTLWGLHLVTEAGALQQTDHLDQGVLLEYKGYKVVSRFDITHLGKVLCCAGNHTLTLLTLPGVVIQCQAGQGAGAQQTTQVLECQGHVI